MIAPAALSAGTRTAGLVVVLGYLLGLVPGPLVAAVGGLALVTFGRAVLVERSGELRAGASLAVMAAAVGVAGLRWGTIELSDLRGVQAVLGPTVLVEPRAVATGCWLAALGAVLALSVWLGTAHVRDRVGLALWGVEAVAGSLAVASVFWGPALGSAVAADLGIWALATVAVLLPSVVLGWFLPQRRPRWTWLALILAAVLVGVGAGLVAVNT